MITKNAFQMNDHSGKQFTAQNDIQIFGSLQNNMTQKKGKQIISTEEYIYIEQKNVNVDKYLNSLRPQLQFSCKLGNGNFTNFQSNEMCQ